MLKLSNFSFFSFPSIGCTVGSIFTMPVSGLLTRFNFDGGWPAAFYPFGKFHVTFKIARISCRQFYREKPGEEKVDLGGFSLTLPGGGATFAGQFNF